MSDTSPTTEERIWSVLTHLSALAFGMGILIPIIGWAEQRQKSRYVSFQCLQALGYQSLGYTVWLLSYILIITFFLLLSVFVIGAGADDRNLISVWSGAFVLIAFASIGAYIIIPIVAAIATALGKDFRYPIMGNRLLKYLRHDQTGENVDQLIEEREDRWVIAMGHLSVILVIWGILVPFVAWVMQGKRSGFVRFQAIQTLIYQAFTTLLYFGSVFVMMLAFIPMAMLGALDASGGSGEIFAIGFVIVTLIVAMLGLLILPLFHILGQWAGYRVLKGENYHYPVVGALVEKGLAKRNLESGSLPTAPVPQNFDKDASL